MKIVLNSLMTVSLFVALFSANLAFAQERVGTKNDQSKIKKDSSVVSFNIEPIWLLLSGIGADVEIFLTERSAINLGGIYVAEHPAEASYSSSDKDVLGNYSWSKKEVNLGYKYMFTGSNTVSGFYMTPSIGYTTASITHVTDLNYEGTASATFARLMFGRQWVLPSHFRFALAGGLATYQKSDIVVKDGQGQEVLREKSPAMSTLNFDFQIGYLF